VKQERAERKTNKEREENRKRSEKILVHKEKHYERESPKKRGKV